MGFFAYWALIYAVLLLLPENAFPSAGQTAKPKDTNTQN
jgi:hypothetical protein